MSVSLRFLSPGDAETVGAVSRSASFASFGVHGRRSWKSSGRNSVRSRMFTRPSKVYGTLRRGSVLLDPRPQQVKRMFEALKRGLREHLRVQQAELDSLWGRHPDTQRSSRLAFYYDLDKQTRLVERYIRKMEFYISKVDELYEGYCIQQRLRDGASNMRRAFSSGPASRASRDSLQELGRSLQECTEDMWLIEAALEVHLGEFLVRMKGLVGYARLCPGDQYEVLMRLGRQRWRLKGRIESADSQTWEEEEKAFVPSVHESLEIKVTELRGLSSLLVGAAACDTADFFTTQPQVIVVDVTELGTVKLQLEVVWNPFGSDGILVLPSPTGKYSLGSRKGSLYSWTPPSTPSFRERYFLQPALPSTPRATSVLARLTNGALQSPGPEPLGTDAFGSEDRGEEAHPSASAPDGGFLPSGVSPAPSGEEAGAAPLSLGLLPERARPPGTPVPEPPGRRGLGVDGRTLPGGPPFHNQEEEDGERELAGPAGGPARPLKEVLELLRAAGPARPPLRELEYQVLGFRDRLQPWGARASAESLMDCILESFAFLQAHLAPDERALFAGSLGAGKDGAPPSPASLTSSSGELPAGDPELDGELTAGDPELDVLLTVHLHVCKALLQKLQSPNLSALVRDCLLEEAEQQRQVLELLADLDFQKASTATCVEEILPQAACRRDALLLWGRCTQPGRPLSCPARALRSQLERTLLPRARLRGKSPGQLDAVCRRLLEQVASCGGLLPAAGLPGERTVTWFQWLGYLRRQRVAELDQHLAQLCKEVALGEELSRRQARALRKLKGRRLGRLQPLPHTLRAWALLQLDGPPKLRRAARARLAGAAGNRSFREKALIFYTNALADSDPKLQQAACVALQQLRGVESLEQLAGLCQSELEAVRAAAREATLSFGEKGRAALEKMAGLCGQDADVEITVF
ncbi:RIPOR family member 3 [Perognathus longimembris pacificus]|uniref:RIPOR family member 3 n=1 Tax=Perognathus longimembris pacificus TaxID=214514 RepID=UPI002019783A|nr:RIPOR family member 3 [Perognathus longimembris pacificus]